jgi:hypothetical protein
MPNKESEFVQNPDKAWTMAKAEDPYRDQAKYLTDYADRCKEEEDKAFGDSLGGDPTYDTLGTQIDAGWEAHYAEREAESELKEGKDAAEEAARKYDSDNLHDPK